MRYSMHSVTRLCSTARGAGHGLSLKHRLRNGNGDGRSWTQLIAFFLTCLNHHHHPRTHGHSIYSTMTSVPWSNLAGGVPEPHCTRCRGTFAIGQECNWGIAPKNQPASMGLIGQS